MTDENDQQQVHLNSFRHYIQHLGEAKKGLEKLLESIEKNQVNDIEKIYVQIETLHTKHSFNCCTASGHYGAGNLYEISGCSSSLNEYNTLVDKLYDLKNRFYKNLKSSQCSYEKCKKANLTSPLIYQTNSVTGIQTVFCNQTCLDKYLEELKSLNKQSNIHESKSQPTNNCANCNKTCLWRKKKTNLQILFPRLSFFSY